MAGEPRPEPPTLDMDASMQDFDCESPIRPSTPSPVVSPIALRIYEPDNTCVAIKFKNILDACTVSKPKINILREYKDEEFWHFCLISSDPYFHHLYVPSTGPGNHKRAVTKKENRVRKGILTQFQPSYITIEGYNLAAYLSSCLVPLGDRLCHEKPLTQIGKNAVWSGKTLAQFFDNGDNVYKFEQERIYAKACTLFKNSDEIFIKLLQLAENLTSIQEASDIVEEHKVEHAKWEKERKYYERRQLEDPDAKIPPEPYQPHIGYSFTLEYLEFYKYMKDVEKLKNIYLEG